jgi:hypothetical protein
MGTRKNRKYKNNETRRCRSFNQTGFIYPASFFPGYIANNLRFGRMKTMALPKIDTSDRIADFGTKNSNIVFLGEIQPLGKSKLHVSDSIKSALRGKTVVINLESPVCHELGKCRAQKSILPSFAMDVDEFKRIVHAFGLDYTKLIVNIANNHSFDTGPDAIDTTTHELESLGCKVIGTTERPHCMVDGVRMIGCTSRLNLLASPHAKRIIQPDDIPLNDNVPTIVYIHWGWEYYEDPDEQSVALAKQLANMTGCSPNANIIGIVGHGPHVLQKVCKYNNTICAYSLGDTVVRSKRPVSVHNPRALSGMVKCNIEGGKMTSMHMIPLLQSHKGTEVKLFEADTEDSLERYRALRGIERRLR